MVSIVSGLAMGLAGSRAIQIKTNMAAPNKTFLVTGRFALAVGFQFPIRKSDKFYTY